MLLTPVGGGGDRSNRRKTCTNTTFSTTHFTRTELGLTPVFRGENPWLNGRANVRCRNYKAWDCIFTNQAYVIVSLGRVFVTCCELEQVA